VTRSSRLALPAAALLVLLAVSALAVKPGGTLYIKAKDTKVLEKPDAKAKVLGLLQPGTSVTWRGADPANRLLHHVEGVDSRGQKLDGYVLQGNLTPSQLAPEYLKRDDGKPIDPQAFKSSGAATKALDEAAVDYAKAKQMPQQAERLMALESINRAVTAQRLAERSRALGLAWAGADEAPSDAKPGKKKGKR
jgi:hypothetical protein